MEYYIFCTKDAGMIDMLDVYLEKKYYYPGDEVRGSLVLNMYRDAVAKNGIIKMSYIYLGYDPMRNIIYKKEYLDWKHEFIKKEKLNKGVYTYEFKFNLPEEIPPSYRGRYIEGVLKYEASVEIPPYPRIVKKGEIYIVSKTSEKIREKVVSGGGADINFTLIFNDPLIGFKELKGVLILHEARNVNRVTIEACINEWIGYTHLKLFKHRYSISRCLARKNYVIRGLATRQLRFTIDLGKPFRGTYVYTSPYFDENIRIMPLLRIIFHRAGRPPKEYEIPFHWYVHGETEAIETYIDKEVKVYMDIVSRDILRYFEEYDEGDAMDIYLYLTKKGLSISIEEINKILDDLVDREILEISSDDPILRKYRIKL